MELSEKEKIDLTWMSLLSNVADNTGMHGLPNINRHRNIFRKLFWVLILIAATTLLIILLHESISKYLSYPAQTNVIPQTVTKLEFPAVTFCNMNTVRYSQLASLGASFADYTGAGEQYEEQPSANTSWSDYKASKANGKSANEQDFYFNYQTLNASDRRRAGHQVETMLISCTYLGYDCGPEDLSFTADAIYGNCFTFNNGHNSTTVRTANKAGPQNSLTLILYLEENEYVQELSDTSGIRMAVHNKTHTPFPEDHGFTLAPGFESYVGLKRVEQTLTTPPYGPCEKISNATNLKKNMYAKLDDLHHKDYTTEACKYTCFMRNLINICQCYDGNFPLADTFIDLWEDTPTMCLADSECLEEVRTSFLEGTLGCNSHSECPPECNFVHHEKTLSHGVWPVSFYEPAVMGMLYDKSEYIFNEYKTASDADQSTFIRYNVLKVRIYLESMDYKLIETEPSYQITQLLSDMGGQFGLWLGFSVCTFFELIELIMDLAILLYAKCGARTEVVQMNRASVN